MPKHYLETLFSPTSIAVIGASDKPNSVGMKVFKNLRKGKFKGKLYPINQKHKKVQGYPCFYSVKMVKHTIDLAIIATPAKTVPAIIAECGEKGIRTVIILSSGFSEIGDAGKSLEKELLETAHKHHVRILGPNCLGVMRPSVKMNASFDNNFALPGSIAFVSQSGALSAGILDWAMTRKIGFSAMVSLGNNADLDFGDVVDYLATDPKTKSILLYIEGIKNPHHFMNALQKAARLKPVIAIKAGKNAQGSRAALSHTGALIGSDEVFDEVLRRSGCVRVAKMEDLFYAAEILASSKKVEGNRLAIITNGGGAGVIAADCASELNINLTTLSDKLVQQLNKVLPSQWSHQNPIDIIGDATPDRYHQALEICKKDDNIDAILIILVPVAMTNPLKVAKQVIQDAKKSKKLILACWMGQKHVEASWELFAKHKIPCFDTPEKAVEAFSYLADYARNQKLLAEAPQPRLPHLNAKVKKVQEIFQSVLAEKRTLLTAYESKNILKLFGIPVTETIEAKTLAEAVEAAKVLGYPVVMKINSPDITHKSAVGGVCANLKDAKEVGDNFKYMMTQVKSNCPKAVIFGVTIEPQFKNLFDREVMIGVLRDPVFGPVISFGAGGTLVEIIQDKSLALPPLNRFLVQQLISKIRILKPGGKLHALTAKQLKNIIQIILHVSDMACEIPQIQEMDINPLILDESGMVAVDARIVISQ